MTDADIANVEIVSTNDLCDLMELPLDAAGLQARLEDCTSRWTTGSIDPEEFDVSDPPEPTVAFKPLRPVSLRFRSSL